MTAGSQLSGWKTLAPIVCDGNAVRLLTLIVRRKEIQKRSKSFHANFDQLAFEPSFSLGRKSFY